MELYVHIPFCVRKCEYCDFLSAPADERLQNRYVGALLHEIRYYGQTMGRPALSTIYIGGGTPSLLAPEYIALLLKQIQVSFEVEADAEITIECNPGTLNEEKLLTYKEVGINRLSIGLQSAFDDELKILGRIHTYRQFLENYECARRCGFENINVDLMSALPYQSTEKFVTSLKRVIALKPEHISAYSLIIEKGTPFMKNTNSRQCSGKPESRQSICHLKRRSMKFIKRLRRFLQRQVMSIMKYPIMQSRGKRQGIISDTGSGYRILG